MVSVAVSEPVVVGVNVTLMRQELPAATGLLVEQVVPVEATAKELPVGGVMPMLEMDRAAFPVLFRVIDCAPLVVPTFWPLKVRLEADRLAYGPVAVKVVEPLIRLGGL
jgi:hypothetical protein